VPSVYFYVHVAVTKPGPGKCPLDRVPCLFLKVVLPSLNRRLIDLLLRLIPRSIFPLSLQNQAPGMQKNHRDIFHLLYPAQSHRNPNQTLHQLTLKEGQGSAPAARWLSFFIWQDVPGLNTVGNCLPLPEKFKSDLSDPSSFLLRVDRWTAETGRSHRNDVTPGQGHLPPLEWYPAHLFTPPMNLS